MHIRTNDFKEFIYYLFSNKEAVFIFKNCEIIKKFSMLFFLEIFFKKDLKINQLLDDKIILNNIEPFRLSFFLPTSRLIEEKRLFSSTDLIIFQSTFNKYGIDNSDLKILRNESNTDEDLIFSNHQLTNHELMFIKNKIEKDFRPCFIEKSSDENENLFFNQTIIIKTTKDLVVFEKFHNNKKIETKSFKIF